MTSRDIQRLATEVARLKAAVNAGRSSGLAFSSIENGSIDSHDEAGNVRMVVGRQWDGTQSSTVVVGPKPPTPDGLTVEGAQLQFTATWSGAWRGGNVSPMDFARVEVHRTDGIVRLPDVGIASTTRVGTIETTAGSSLVARSPQGQQWVWLVARSQSGQVSDPSSPVSVTVSSAVSTEVLDKLQADLTTNTNNLAATQVLLSSARNDLYNPGGLAWNIQSSLDATKARGADLVTNGSAQSKTNTNFPGMFYGADSPTGASGSFISTASSQVAQTGEAMALDPNKRYRLSIAIRETVASVTNSRCYLGLAIYDAFGNSVLPQHYAFKGANTTTLTQDLVPGATSIKVASTAGFAATDPANFALIWAYVDESGKRWPYGTYSRLNPTISAISADTLTIAAWKGPTIPAGTQVSPASRGAVYMYFPAGTNTLVTPNWTTLAGEYGGLHDGSTHKAASTAFPAGTASARVVFVLGQGNPASRQAVAQVSLSEASAALQAAYTAQGAATAASTVAGTAKTTADSAATAASAASGKADAAKAAADTARSDAAAASTAASSASSAADKAKADAATAQAQADEARKRADAAGSSAGSANSAATAAQTRADAAREEADKAKADAATAKAAADVAKARADAAQDMAGTAKSAADGATTKANAAQAQADSATTAAGSAQATANAAQTTASGKNTVQWSTNAPADVANAAGTKSGDIYNRYSLIGNKLSIIETWQSDGVKWRSTALNEVYLPQVNIGTGTYGELDGFRLKAKSVQAGSILVDGSVGRVLIADGAVNASKIVAQEVAGAVAAFIELDVSQLRASAASINVLAANKIFADVFAANKITANEINAGSIGAAVGSFVQVKADQITGGVINAEIAMWTNGRIIAGNWMGSCAVMSGLEGFTTRQVSEDGVQFTATQLGNPNSQDSLAIYPGPNSPPAFEVTSEGKITAESLNTTTDISVAGTPMVGKLLDPDSEEGWLDPFPRGTMAWGDMSALVSGKSWAGGSAGSFFPIGVLGFQTQPNRTYRISISTRFDVSAIGAGGGRAAISLHCTQAAAPDVAEEPTPNSTRLTDNMRSYTSNSPGTNHTISFPWDPGNTVLTNTKILISGFAINCTMAPSTYNATDWSVSVEDVGPAKPSTLRSVVAPSTGGGGGTTPPPPPPAKQTYVTTWRASDSSGYYGLGSYSRDSYGNDRRILRHGYWDGSTGNLRSAAIFRNNGISGEARTMAAVLDGATVSKAEIWVQSLHWFYSSGGTARFWQLDETTLPATLSSTPGVPVTKKFTARSQGYWITVPKFWFSPTRLGFIIGPGGDNSRNNYGYFASAVHGTVAYRPQVRLTYTR